MAFRIENLPRMSNIHLRAFTVRTDLTGEIPMRRGAEPGVLLRPVKSSAETGPGASYLGHALQSIEVANGIGLDWTAASINIDRLKEQIEYKPEKFIDIALRGKEDRTPENLFAAIVGRLGREDLVLTFNVIDALQKYDYNSEAQNTLLAAAARHIPEDDFARGKFLADVIGAIRLDYFGIYPPEGLNNPAQEQTRAYFLEVMRKVVGTEKMPVERTANFLSGFMGVYEANPATSLEHVDGYASALDPQGDLAAVVGIAAKKIFGGNHSEMGSNIGRLAQRHYPIQEHCFTLFPQDALRARARFIARAAQSITTPSTDDLRVFAKEAIYVASAQNRVSGDMRTRIEFRRIFYGTLRILDDPNLEI